MPPFRPSKSSGARIPGCDIELVIDATTHGQNQKVSSLINMTPHVRGDIVVLADSDMRVVPDYLSRVVASLLVPGIGGVSCVYHGVATTGVWAQLAALGINAHFLPGVVVGLETASDPAMLRLDDRPAPRDAIGDRRVQRICRRSGGRLRRRSSFASARLRNVDTFLFRRPRLHRVVSARTVAPRIAVGVHHQEHRSPRVCGLGRGAGVAVGAHRIGDRNGGGAPWPALIIAAMAVACRLALLKRVEQAFGLPPQAYWLVPARDLVSFAIFVASYFGRGISWKGRSYRLASDGTLTANRRSPDP